jgi:pimeloyl-ACP methyl ester carboxylesterase
MPSAISSRSPATLLCIHASASGGRSWQALTAPLKAHMTVLTPDRLGCSDTTPWPTGVPTDFDAEAAFVESALPARTQDEGFHLLGHSFGGAVALQVALRWPERVKSLTLFEPTRFSLIQRDPNSRGHYEEIEGVAATVSQCLATSRPERAARHFVDYWSADGAWDRLESRQQQRVMRHMPKVGAEFAATDGDRLTPRSLSRLTMPVRLMTGDASPAPVRRITELLARHLPLVERVGVAGVGHMAPLTDPQRVADHLPAWLQPLPQALVASAG